MNNEKTNAPVSAADVEAYLAGCYRSRVGAGKGRKFESKLVIAG